MHQQFERLQLDRCPDSRRRYEQSEIATFLASPQATYADDLAVPSEFEALASLSCNTPVANSITAASSIDTDVLPVNYSCIMNDEAKQQSQFPSWLKARLERRGWSVADLNVESGIAQTTIRSWLRGERRLTSPDLIQTLAYSLDTSIDEVLEVLDLREGGADRTSLAVRALAPTIDKYDWTDEDIEHIRSYIDDLGGFMQKRFSKD